MEEQDQEQEQVSEAPHYEDIVVDDTVSAHDDRRRNVAVFWRRLGAFVLDFLLLGAAGFVLGLFGGGFFARIGNWGKLVGFALAFLYFVPQDSLMGEGQTLGKRLLKVRVVDKDGGLISPSMSALRYIIVAGPIFLNGIVLSYGPFNGLVVYLTVVVVFGIGGGMAYLSVFNRKTRQSLQDLICGTFVEHEDVEGTPTEKAVSTVHYVVYGVYFACIIGFMIFGMPRLTSMDFFKKLEGTQAALERMDGVRSSSVMAGRYLNPGGDGSYINATVVLDAAPESYGDVVDKAARVVVTSYPDIDKADVVTVEAMYGYDIGIYKSYKRYMESRKPSEWRRDLGMDKRQ